MSEECENGFRVLGGLESKTADGAEFGSELWGEVELVDEVGECE